jgi:hypothetical protein
VRDLSFFAPSDSDQLSIACKPHRRHRADTVSAFRPLLGVALIRNKQNLSVTLKQFVAFVSLHGSVSRADNAGFLLVRLPGMKLATQGIMTQIKPRLSRLLRLIGRAL